ncbi:uncharacterized protein [Salminus brasiliensis]|uniref:uncharacterized protein n=1 Tax=Salminus brasiliensis TaxID=930266 RepID=UPI003B830F52
MAEEGRSVCVRGLPADLDPERLTDKLHIHFLRCRNGGGEITSVSVNAGNRFAVVTFEDSKVALNVLSHCPHILEVDGKEYELSVSVPGQESSLLNKVILEMSATIDCSQLPLGEEIVKNLCEKHPDLRVQFTRPQRHCTLYGPYSEVQAVVSYLVELLGDLDPERAERSSLGREQTVGLGQQREASPAGIRKSLYQEAKAAEIHLQKQDKEGDSMDLLRSQDHSAEDRKVWIEEADVEPLSLIMEADVFAYLRSRSEQYKYILLCHGVHVVDVTSDGVTTLYLQSDVTGKSRSETEKHMKQALKELRQLYQQLEGNLRRAQVQMSAVGLGGGNTKAFKELQSLLPKVLLTCDQTYVYIVGESSDVSQAKQILLLGSGSGHELSPTAKIESSLSSSLSNCYSSTSEEEATQISEKRGRSRTAVPKTNLPSSEPKVKGSEGYKLAARFKNSEMGLPGFYPGERVRGRELRDLPTSMNTLTLASNFEPTPLSRSSLGTAGTVSGDQSGASPASPLRVTGAQRTDDILFNNMDPLFPFGNTFKTTRPITTKVGGMNCMESTSALTPAVKAPPSTSQNVLSGLDTYTLSTYPSTPRSYLKRANSFSGRPSPKQEAQKTGTSERSRLATGTEKRVKSNSLSNGKPIEERTKSIASREVIVSTVMWNYMKEAYRSRLDGLMSDLEVTEILSDKNEVKVILKGPESSKVEECQSRLQKLIVMIASDFRIQELQLADLGMSESSEVFKECCLNIQSRFSKLSVHSTKDTVLLIGPELLCSQASEMLKEVFFHEILNSLSSETLDEGQANALASHAPFQSSRQFSPNQTKVYSERLEGHYTNQALGHKGSQSESWTVSFAQSPKQKTASKEKAKDGGPGYLETSKVNAFLSQSSEVSEVLVGTRDDWPNRPSLTTQRKQKSSTLTAKQTSQQVHNKSEQSVGGDSGLLHPDQIRSVDSSQKVLVHPLKKEQNAEDLKRKDAGKDPKQAQGIQGTMTYVELPLSLSGYGRYTTAKITYIIPDGIQGKEHPNPGSPFQGGVFEAYLPLSSMGQSLLPRLEKAFKQGLTFRVCSSKKTKGGQAQIWWYRIPHKTKMEGGKSGNGYPDSTYLHSLSDALLACGIEDATLTENSAKS